jgi:hypothetical protein
MKFKLLIAILFMSLGGSRSLLMSVLGISAQIEGPLTMELFCDQQRFEIGEAVQIGVKVSNSSNSTVLLKGRPVLGSEGLMLLVRKKGDNLYVNPVKQGGYSGGVFYDAYGDGLGIPPASFVIFTFSLSNGGFPIEFGTQYSLRIQCQYNLEPIRTSEEGSESLDFVFLPSGKKGEFEYEAISNSINFEVSVNQPKAIIEEFIKVANVKDKNPKLPTNFQELRKNWISPSRFDHIIWKERDRYAIEFADSWIGRRARYFQATRWLTGLGGWEGPSLGPKEFFTKLAEFNLGHLEDDVILVALKRWYNPVAQAQPLLDEGREILTLRHRNSIGMLCGQALGYVPH